MSNNDSTATLKYWKRWKDVVDPTAGTSSSACYDLSAYLNFDNNEFSKEQWGNIYVPAPKTDNTVFNTVLLAPGSLSLIPTGIHMDIPEGYHVKIYMRSSTGVKLGLAIPQGVGIIDSDYVDECYIPVYVMSKQYVTIEHGQRLAQFMLVKNVPTSLVPIENCPEKKGNRTGGFGSTGK